VIQTTIPAIAGLNRFPLTYGSVWSNPIIASDLEHANTPLPSGFAGDGYDLTGTSQSLNFSLSEIAAADSNFQLNGFGSTGQNNVDAAWLYTLVDEQLDASAYFQLPSQSLHPDWSIDRMFLLPDVLATPLVQYQTSTTASSFGHTNPPPNDPFTVQQPYQQALTPLPPSPEAPQNSALTPIYLPRQHPTFLTARKTAKAADKNRFQCHEGCTRTFGRPGDLRRHLKKHKAHQFKCVDIDCSKTFYRLDKLRDHAKQVHGFNL
jgi:hypothetical protein